MSCTLPLSEVHPTHVGEKIQAMMEEVVRAPGTKWMLLTQYWGQDWQGEREGESLESVLALALALSMLVPIALVVGMKDCLQTNYGDAVHCCTKFHVCQLFISTLIFI